ncbi:MAG TPA: BMP family ABC transporter substrate-binding protein [Anaerolineales bacterium]
MNQELSFGAHVRQQRREMDLTQEELARRVGCAAITLRKIEADDLRASVQIAERLAMALSIPLEERAEFVRWARSVRPASSDLPQITPPPAIEEIGREDLTGRAIRGYALAERIGMGGFGSVYRAVQPNVEREVAVKIILPAFANHPDFIRRFEAEAQLVARLEHPHIVPLYDYWREPGVAYLVMRLLRGGNIQTLLGQGPLSIETTTKILEQICSALNAAHRIGIIHRDLKPANVLLDEDSNSYLADFGIAKNLGNPDFESHTSVDAMIGSPQYMSPEQIQSLSIRPQTDIYCLGVMLYEMLTGAVPFTGPTPFDLIQHHVNTPLPPLSARRAGLPAALDEVITRATEKDPEKRYADAQSLYNDFRQAIGRVADAHPVTVIYDEEESDVEITNPFKGLRPFNESDEENFFGRETLVQQLLARLGEGGELSRFLGVIGPSGSGKSSVVRAGLIPALRRGGLPGSENWFVVDMLPGTHPFEELEASLLRVAINPPESLLSQLKDGSRGLLRAVHRILPADNSVELVLVIDQFEEIFTLVQDEAERALLLESLANAVMDERSRLRVIVTLRADFTDKPLRYVDFGEIMNRRFEFVLPLTADEVERAVAGPAQRVGLKLEKGLVSTIIREAGNQPGTLPLLQYALSELFEKREGRTLTNKAYREIGGVLGALGRRAEAIYTKLDETSQSASRQLFLRLVTLGEGTEDTRRRVLREELEGLTTVNGPYSKVIDRFGKARLLTFDHDPITRSATIEVAHEALIREWVRLREWLMESRADVRNQRQLAHAAQEWENAKRDTSFLLTGARLEQFEGWVMGTSVALTNAEQEFLSAGITERNRRESEESTRQQRELENAQKLAETERQRADEQTRSASQLRKRAIYLAGVLAVALFMAVTAILFGRQAQIASRLATSRELAAASISSLDIDPERSILLALKALDASHTSEAEDALHRAVQASRLQLVIQAQEPGAAGMVAFSPDGEQLVTAASDETVKVWNVSNGSQELKLDGRFAAWSPDENQLAVVSADGTVRMYDPVTGKQIPLPGQVDAKLSMAFSPDGRRLLTVAYGNLPIIWNSKTGSELTAFPGHTDFIGNAVFSPDGTRILTASDDGTARVWDAGNGGQLLELAHTGFVWSAAYSPDGKTIATASGNETYLWDATSGEKVLTLAGHRNDVYFIAFSPDGTHLATGSLDRKIKIWDTATGVELFSLAGHVGAIYGLSFSPDGKRLASSSDDGTVRIWDVSPSREFLTLPLHGSSGQITYSADGSRMATSGANGTIKIWDARTGRDLITIPDSGTYVKDLLFSPDETLLFSAGADSRLRVWNPATGSLLTELPAHSGPVNGLAITQDGMHLATAGDDYKAKIWMITNGMLSTEPLFTLEHPGSVYAVAFSRDGLRLVTSAQDGAARIWDTASGRDILTLRGHVDLVSAVTFNFDGSRVATTSWDGTARIWDAFTGQQLLELRGHTNGVTSIAFSVDGSRIATVSRDGTAKLWDSATGNELLTFSGDGSGLNDLSLSPDGKLLAIGGDNGVRVYLLQLDDLIALAHTRVTRSLNGDECLKYLHLDQSTCAPATAVPTTTAIPATDQRRVCQITNTGGLYDNSFNQMIFKGLQYSNIMLGWDTRVMQSVSTSDYEKNVREFLRGDCDLIIGLFQMTDTIQSAAVTNPEQKFQVMDYVYEQPLENVRMQIFATDQAAFQAGYAAASVSKTGKIGVFGGIDIPPVTDFMDGFALGVRYYNQKNGANVEVLGWDAEKHEGLFIGGFCCSAEGRQITQELLDQGADIILPVAGTNVGPGAAYAVKSYGNAYIIGVDTDWAVTESEFADIVLTSILKNYDASVVQAVQAIENNTFTGGIQIGTLETGEVSLAPFYQFDSLISPGVKAELEQIKADIITGKIKTKP